MKFGLLSDFAAVPAESHSRRTIRFCIIGAGAAGLVAADSLRSLGYRNITVLEKDGERVGGKCRTLEVGEEAVNVGAIYVFPHYPMIQGLARRLGIGIQRSSRFVHADI